ncbi:MAG TPA: serine hydrolase domain-containing protein [Allosphingosinicella sp.]|jgi:CubicO group peptidase (beta-lactamase class C family)
MSFVKAFGFIALAASAAPATAAQPVPAAAPRPADLRARADAILEAAYPADGPGAAVIVTRGGRIVYAAGRGLADLEARRPITPQTVFRLGSITKQFTAAVILQLVAEGRISLDDPVTRFFPDYPQPGGRATVRQLLNHTSGIQSYTGIPGWMTEANTNRPYSTAQMIALFRDLPSPSEPGQRWDYNNSGYVLLGAIVESVTGMPWHQAVAERIARPLGLGSISYGVTGEAAPAMARGYTDGEGGTARLANRIHMSVPHGAGGLVGTVEDLAIWARALHSGRVVSPALYQEMIRPTALPDGGSHPYGFGLGFDELRGRPTIGHGGGIFGFNTDSFYIPSEDIFVAVFANSDDPATAPGLVARRLAALALGEPFPEFRPVPADRAAVEPLLGIYRVGPEGGAERRFFTREGRYYTQREDGPELEIFPAGDDRFFYGPNSLTWFRIARREDGAHVMEMHQNGANEAEAAVRTGPVPPEAPPVVVPPEVLRTYVGTYTTEGPEVTIALGADGRLTVQLSGQPALGMRALSQTEFQVDRVGARIVFHVEGGAATRLVIHQGGRELEGRRVVR